MYKTSALHAVASSYQLEAYGLLKQAKESNLIDVIEFAKESLGLSARAFAELDRIDDNDCRQANGDCICKCHLR